ncbi:MAG: trigger factor [Mucinivorans sp.]
MNVTRADQPGQTTTITVTIAAADYTEKLEKALKEQKRKAVVPGFRPGMVPMAMINKMYRKGAMADITYRLATDAAFEFIKKEEIDPLGDLMPSDEQKEIDFDSQADFDFVFEIGLAPKINIEFTDKDQVEKITVEPSAEMIEGYTDNFLRRFGKLIDVDKVEKEEAVSCTLTNDETKIDEAYVGLISLSDDERKPFIGRKVGDKMTVNVNELYKDPKQRAAILSIKEDELAAMNPVFELTVTKIRKFENPKLDADFFALAFADGSVKDEKAFAAQMKEQVSQELAQQTEFKWLDTVRHYAITRQEITLPDLFLKNWLYQMNQGKFTMEQIEGEFEDFKMMMKWDLVKRTVARAEKLEVSKEDATNEAKAMALAQFRQYGMASVPEDMLASYAEQILSKEEEAKKMYETAGEKKVIAALAAKLAVKETKMTVEEFSEMMKKEQAK